MAASLSQSVDPPLVSPSPVGYHISNLLLFFSYVDLNDLQPISSHPIRQYWMTDEGRAEIGRTFPDTLAGVLNSAIRVWNSSHDTDRICPSCRRWYRVGEPEQYYESLDSFLKRNPLSFGTVSPGRAMYRDEQDRSGICSPACFDAMEEDVSEAAENYGKGLQRSGSWLLRRTTRREAEDGLKIMWERINAAG
ncbi:MAG: hypothetical protein Q9191_005515 [Dirinaria sp. TL-2023a]